MWSLTKRRRDRAAVTSAQQAEIHRLREVQRANELGRTNLILEIRTIEAEIRSIQSDVRHEPSATVRGILEHRLLSKLAERSAAEVKAARLAEAMEPITLLKQRREELELADSVVDARELDTLIIEYQAMIATRRDTAMAIAELRGADKEHPARRSSAAPETNSPPLFARSAQPMMSEEMRRHLSIARLLIEE